VKKLFFFGFGPFPLDKYLPAGIKATAGAGEVRSLKCTAARTAVKLRLADLTQEIRRATAARFAAAHFVLW
jgi:hypothetical protein